MTNETRIRKHSLASLFFFFLALVPLPIGLLTIHLDYDVKGRIRETFPQSWYDVVFTTFALLCCIGGCIGMLLCRFKRRSPSVFFVGICLGLYFSLVEAFFIWFVSVTVAYMGVFHNLGP